MKSPSLVRKAGRAFEADARQLVPVDDEIGGTVIYLGGRPAYYVLNDEWFEAVKMAADAVVTDLPGRARALADELDSNEEICRF